MTKSDIIEKISKEYKIVKNDFMDGKLFIIEGLDKKELEEMEHLVNLSYLYPYISFSIFMKDILQCEDRLEDIMHDERLCDVYREEQESYFRRFSGQYFFSERYVRRED